MRALVIAVLCVVGSCHKEPIGGPASTVEADALWKLAPDGAMVGIVASPRAVAMTEHAWADVQKWIASAPELAPLAQELDAGLAKLLGSAKLDLAALGLSATKGGAIFVVKGGAPIVVVPLGDRDKFLALAKGKKGAKLDTIKDAVCKTTHDVYACARTEAELDSLGTGHLADGLGAAKARGDLELVVKDAPVGGGATLQVAVVAQLERGAVTVRGAIRGAPPPVLAMMAGGDKPRTDGERTTGFVLAHVKPAIAQTAGMVEGEAAEFLKTLGDPLTITMRTDPDAVELELPLHDPALFDKALQKCERLPIPAKTVDGACRITIPKVGTTIDVWLDGTRAIRAALHKDATGGAKVGMTKLGNELADGKWSFAFWGHGTAFAPIPADLVQQLPPEVPLDGVQIGVRVLATLNEIALASRVDDDTIRIVFSVRTMWSNPDDVVAKISAITAADIIAGKSQALAKAIADAAPGSPFAVDTRAGYTGMLAPAAVFGVLAAVAVPAFMEYMKKSKRSMADLQLNKIGKSMKIYYAENAAFPIGDAPLTPKGPCCGGTPTNKCAVDPAAWQANKIWTALDFQIDEPTLYQFSYHSDGKTAVVKAVSDLDCDGQPATTTLTATIDQGNNPQMTITSPAAGTY